MVKADFLICTGGTVTDGALSALQEDIILNICEVQKCTAGKVCS
jgi:hypothetical protein